MTVQAISLIPQDMPWQASLFVDTEKLEKLEKEITPSSGNILTEGRKTMTAGTDEAGENTETTGDGNDEKKQ